MKPKLDCIYYPANQPTKAIDCARSAANHILRGCRKERPAIAVQRLGKGVFSLRCKSEAVGSIIAVNPQ